MPKPDLIDVWAPRVAALWVMWMTISSVGMFAAMGLHEWYDTAITGGFWWEAVHYFFAAFLGGALVFVVLGGIVIAFGLWIKSIPARKRCDTVNSTTQKETL